MMANKRKKCQQHQNQTKLNNNNKKKVFVEQIQENEEKKVDDDIVDDGTQFDDNSVTMMMATNDDALCCCTVNRIPHECWRIILSYLPMQKALQLRAVCRHMEEVVITEVCHRRRSLKLFPLIADVKHHYRYCVRYIENEFVDEWHDQKPFHLHIEPGCDDDLVLIAPFNIDWTIDSRDTRMRLRRMFNSTSKFVSMLTRLFPYVTTLTVHLTSNPFVRPQIGYLLQLLHQWIPTQLQHVVLCGDAIKTTFSQVIRTIHQASSSITTNLCNLRNLKLHLIDSSAYDFFPRPNNTDLAHILAKIENFSVIVDENKQNFAQSSLELLRKCHRLLLLYVGDCPLDPFPADISASIYETVTDLSIRYVPARVCTLACERFTRLKRLYIQFDSDRYHFDLSLIEDLRSLSTLTQLTLVNICMDFEPDWVDHLIRTGSRIPLITVDKLHMANFTVFLKRNFHHTQRQHLITDDTNVLNRRRLRQDGKIAQHQADEHRLCRLIGAIFPSLREHYILYKHTICNYTRLLWYNNRGNNNNNDKSMEDFYCHCHKERSSSSSSSSALSSSTLSSNYISSDHYDQDDDDDGKKIHSDQEYIYRYGRHWKVFKEYAIQKVNNN